MYVHVHSSSLLIKEGGLQNRGKEAGGKACLILGN